MNGAKFQCWLGSLLPESKGKSVPFNCLHRCLHVHQPFFVSHVVLLDWWKRSAIVYVYPSRSSSSCRSIHESLLSSCEQCRTYEYSRRPPLSQIIIIICRLPAYVHVWLNASRTYHIRSSSRRKKVYLSVSADSWRKHEYFDNPLLVSCSITVITNYYCSW